jgi:hypothetical protein
MANRFWVGGNGNWNVTDTTNWSTTSGGAGGASAPTSADNVIFDANSNVGTDPFTVTVTGTTAAPAVCNDFTASGLDGVLTFTMGATAFLDCHGSITLPASNFTWTGTAGCGFRLKATTTGKTITTNGVDLNNTILTFDGVGGEWTLGSAITVGGTSIVLLNGSFDTANYNVTCVAFNASSAFTRTLSLGSSTFTCTGNSGFNLGNILNLTFNSGTSQINLAASSPGLSGGSTFYNVSFTTAALATPIITAGDNTYNNLTFTSRINTGVANIEIRGNQTINGTLTFGTANTAIRRMFVFSNTIGTPRTLTANTVATLADVDFRDIVGAGLGTWSGTRLGNCGGNTGITFDAGKDVYRVGTGNWSATQWALTSGGSVDVNNFPLAQDTAIFDTGTTTGTHTIEAAWNIGTLDMSALNVAVTLATGGQQPNIYGDVTLDADVTLTGTGALQFTGASTQTVTSAGRTFTQPFNINKPTTTSLILGDALTSNLVFTLTQGTLNLNDFDLTCLRFASDNTNTRSIAFGTGEINVTGNNATIVSITPGTNFGYTGTPKVNLTYSGSTGTRSLIISTATNLESQVLDFYITAGTDSFMTGNSAVGTLNFTGFSGTFLNGVNRTIYRDLVLSAGMTVSAGTGSTTLGGSGVQNISSAGAIFVHTGISQSNASGTVRLLSNFTFGAFYLHEAGTLDINDFTFTVGAYGSTGSTARSIDFGTGTLAVGGNFTASGSSYTTAGTGSVSMTSASAKTFAGGGFTYPTLNQGGAGTLTITGANTFNNITNTNATASTITFPASTVTRVLNMKLKGNISNLVSMRSSIDGTTYTIQT